MNPHIPSPISRIHPPLSTLKNPAAWLILFLAWAVIYLPGLGTRELQGEEARRVLPGRTMIQTGDWIVPRSAGRIYNRKPPMVNWAAAAAVKLTGKMNEWTVRLPSVLGILAMTLCVHGLGRSFLGGDGAFFAAIVCLTNIGFIEKGRLIEIEALYISFFGIALMLWLHFWWCERPVAAWLTSMPVLGLGFLTKGPVHVLYFYAIVTAIILAEIRAGSSGFSPSQGSHSGGPKLGWRTRAPSLIKHILSWPHLLGLALFFAVFLPWALMNAARNPDQDSGAVWSEQITHRLGFSEFDFTSWLLQIPQSLVNFLPWVLLLPLAWNKQIVAQWKTMERRGVWIRALRNGLVIAFLIIAVLPSSRPRFMLPLNVAGAALLAMLVPLVTSAIRKEKAVMIGRCIFICIWWLAVVIIVAAMFTTFVRPPTSQAFIRSLLLLVAVKALSSRRFVRCLNEWWMKLAGDVIGIAAVGVSMLAFFSSGPAVVNDRLAPFANEIRSHTGADVPLILFRVQERMWPFYLGLSCREIAFQKELPDHAPWIITPKKDRDENLAILTPRYGQPKSEQILKEPATGDAGGKGTEYVLLGF